MKILDWEKIVEKEYKVEKVYDIEDLKLSKEKDDLER